jgi:hypothetical protein
MISKLLADLPPLIINMMGMFLGLSVSLLTGKQRRISRSFGCWDKQIARSSWAQIPEAD